MAAARRKEALGRRRQQAAPAVKRRAPASPAVDVAECSDDMAIPRKRRNTAPAAAPPATVGGESPIGDTTSTDSPRVPNPADDDTATMMMMMDVQETGSTGSRGSRGSRGSGSGSGSGDSGRRSGSSSGDMPVGSASGGSSDGCEEVQVKRRKVEGVVGVMHTGCEGVESGGKPMTAGEDEIEVEEEAQAIQVPA
ncbi:hypothetical protein BC829DRAFT_443662 [Chytridium lagenaria]|nr:hypothetical protein BC829DRAFT_443662 [Chytridium lagenaria]